MTIDFTFTQEDLDLTTEFMMHTESGNLEYFSSDTFRKAKLHNQFCDPIHDIGAFFAKLKANGVAVPVGEIPSKVSSNNKRKVDLYHWDWNKWRIIIRSRLTI